MYLSITLMVEISYNKSKLQRIASAEVPVCLLGVSRVIQILLSLTFKMLQIILLEQLLLRTIKIKKSKKSLNRLLKRTHLSLSIMMLVSVQPGRLDSALITIIRDLLEYKSLKAVRMENLSKLALYSQRSKQTIYLKDKLVAKNTMSSLILTRKKL